MNNYIGIDLGTAYSCIGIWVNDKAEIIPNILGRYLTPSVVGFTPTCVIVGDKAKDQSVKNYKNTIYDLKRYIGRQFNDSIISQDIGELSYIMKQDENKKPIIQVNYQKENKEYKLEIIVALILLKLKEYAEAYINKQVKDVIITVPAHFNIIQRQSTIDAGRIAGLNVLRIINEPTAASITYKLYNSYKDNRYVLIFDLGGGTFDVSIVYLNEDTIELKSTCGDPHLGGEDFDVELMKFCMKNFEVDISNNPKAKMRLRNACENAKKHLSNSEEYTFDIENLAEGTDFNFSINRIDFEVACQELFSRCISCVEQSLIYANLKKEDINDIALVGSSTRIPKMKEMILNYFSKPIQNDSKYFNISINPEEAVAIGASYQIASINNLIGDKQLILNDIVSLPIVIQGQKTISTIFKRGIHIPCKDTKEIKNKIGYDKITIKINQENMTLKKEKSYSLIGEYSIENLDPKIENTFKFIFSIDVNSILSVEATDMKGQKVNLKVKEYYKLKEEDIQKMIKEVNRLNGHIKNQEEISQINHKLKKKFENNIEKKNTIDKFIENKEKDYIPIDEYKKQIKDELKIEDIMFLEK